MHIVTGKAYEVDQEERQRKMQIPAPLSANVQPYAESDGHRDPAKIEDSGHRVGPSPVVSRKKLAKGDGLPAHGDAKPGAFGLIQSTDIYIVDHIIRPNPHPIVRNRKNDKGNQGYGQLPGREPGKEQHKKYACQQEMVSPESDKHACHTEKQCPQGTQPEALPARGETALSERTRPSILIHKDSFYLKL